MNQESNEAAILRTRDNSNRAIARRNLLGVGESLGDDYVGVIGDGTFVSSRAEYLRLFKEGFDRPKQSMLYVRTPEVVNVADDQTLALSMAVGLRHFLMVPSRTPVPMLRCGGEHQPAGRSDQKCLLPFTADRLIGKLGP